MHQTQFSCVHKQNSLPRVEKQVSSHGNVPDVNSRMEATDKFCLSVLVLHHTNDSIPETYYIQKKF